MTFHRTSPSENVYFDVSVLLNTGYFHLARHSITDWFHSPPYATTSYHRTICCSAYILCLQNFHKTHIRLWSVNVSPRKKKYLPWLMTRLSYIFRLCEPITTQFQQNGIIFRDIMATYFLSPKLKLKWKRKISWMTL